MNVSPRRILVEGLTLPQVDMNQEEDSNETTGYEYNMLVE